MSDLPGDVSSGALLLIDIQNSFADPAHLEWAPPEGRAAVAAAVRNVGSLVDATRNAGLKVMWVRLIQDPEHPWPASLWLRGIDLEQWPSTAEPCVAGTSGADFYALHPDPGETIVTKSRYSAFFGTSLDSVLTELGVEWLLVAGLTTECCIQTTIFDAVQLGYKVLLVEDAAAAYESAVHDGAVTALTMHAAGKITTATAVRELTVHADVGTPQ
ncbi:isochorismatase family cysteine hydrolase [Rhodococcus sp. IEGM 1379]|uniref:cysteine hydrolase family protein n=1 Tax=Rhodococcus sp. IEGM 1379 TaxID=3047086 RepID=UPI0024B73A47|nr:isochorismatase family cysteine hydrolase [Rhodococcus sp. IEGM 1379]MDI9918143.1 isochorismatase family cysteine hydrolase [Rhodococcus sp. IEGM 1379]